MTVCIGLLRAINVGGNNKIAMSELKEMFASLDMDDARTILQSGNVVFITREKDLAKIEKQLETDTETRFKVKVDYVWRTDAQLDKIIKANPFPKMAREDPGHLVVMFLKSAPDAKAVQDLRAAIKGREEVRVDGANAYITFPDGIGTSKLTIAVIEKKLATRG